HTSRNEAPSNCLDHSHSHDCWVASRFSVESGDAHCAWVYSVIAPARRRAAVLPRSLPPPAQENLMRRPLFLLLLTCLAASAAPEKKAPPLSMEPRPIASDKSVKYDFDIVYVRAPRKDPTGRSRWAEVGDPRTMEPGADLMLLHPDGSEEVLVAVQPKESIADPYVSFDGQSVYF